MLTVAGDTSTFTGVTVNAEDPAFDGSAADVAVIVTLSRLLTDDGAVYVTGLATELLKPPQSDTSPQDSVHTTPVFVPAF